MRKENGESSERVRPAGKQLSLLPDGETQDRGRLRTAPLLSTAPSCLSVMEGRKDKKAQEGQGSGNRVELRGGKAGLRSSALAFSHGGFE